MKTKNGSTLWVASAVLVLSIFLLIFTSQISPKNSGTVDALCPDIDSFAEKVKTSDNYEISINGAQIHESQTFLWRRAKTEPKVGYLVQSSRVLSVASQDSKTISTIFETKSVQELSDTGYLKQDLNFTPFSKSDFVSGGLGIYGFKKGNQYFSVELYDAPDNQDSNLSSNLVINCGIANSEFDLLYDKIIKTNKYSTNDTIAISDLKDSVVILNVGQINSASGYASFWLVTDTQTQQLIKGTQEQPFCNVFEEIKVGRGLDCYDKKTETSRVVDY